MDRTNVSEQLKLLSCIFNPYATLYAVGGYVRNKLMDLPCADVDICSKLTVDDVKKILLNTDFVVLDKNLRVGTVIIKTRGVSFEYTTFRIDSYVGERGKHSPSAVEFTDDILLDAKRRDFKMNAVYYDAAEQKYIDPLGGIPDIQNKRISAADEPAKVFGEDGLRILRLARFSAELAFDIDAVTFEEAKENSELVGDIVPERIFSELNKILTADISYPALGNKDGHYRGVRILDELGLIQLLLPELYALKGLEQPKKYHIYDAFNHSLEAFKISPPEIRWAALLHDVGKAEAVKMQGNMHGHEVISATLAKNRLKQLKASNSEIKETVRLIENHMVDIDGKTSAGKLCWFVAKNSDLILKLAALRDADAQASTGTAPPANRLLLYYNRMKADGLPFSVKDLKINGEDLVDLRVPENMRAQILNDLWRETILNPALDTREKALAYAAREALKK